EPPRGVPSECLLSVTGDRVVKTPTDRPGRKRSQQVVATRHLDDLEMVHGSGVRVDAHRATRRVPEERAVLGSRATASVIPVVEVRELCRENGGLECVQPAVA